MTHLELRHCRRSPGLAEREAPLVELELPRNPPAAPFTMDRQRPRDRGCDIVAVEQLRLDDVELEIERRSAARKIDIARTRDGAARRGLAGDLIEHQPRPAEAPAGIEVLHYHAGDCAFDARIDRADRAADLRIDQPPADVRADRNRPAEVDDLDPGQAPQRVRRAGVADLHHHRRIGELGDDRAGTERCKPRLGPADGLAVAHRHRAHRRLAAVEHRRQPDVDRLRRQYQPGASEAANAQVGAAARRASGTAPAIIELAGGDPAQAEIGPANVEQLQRHSLQVGVDFGA